MALVQYEDIESAAAHDSACVVFAKLWRRIYMEGGSSK